YEKYLLRHGRELVPTPKAFSLIALLRGLQLPELIAPELTGDWEFKLRQMEHGKLQRDEFMREIAEMTRHIVHQAKQYESDTVPGDFATLTVPCPKCGGVIKENYKKFQCQNCDFALWKIVAGRQFEIPEIEELISKRVVGPLQGFRSKMGKPFDGLIRLNDDLTPSFDFGQTDKDGNGAAEVDFTGKEPLGVCPKCGANVFENGVSYVCEKAVGADKKCDFRSGMIILQQPVDREQMKKLLTNRKTDLLDKFVSKRTGRPFKAYLALEKDGSPTFEFEPKPAKGDKPREKKAKPPKIDFTGKEPIAKCPKCGARVFETEAEYLCEKSQADSKPCKFKVGKVILQRPIDQTQFQKLLTEGKTDLLEFVSAKTGRPFKAWLVLEDSGKTGFEFPPREGETDLMPAPGEKPPKVAGVKT
ncbi:MAG TPA: topoisomerase C-terminal repeat-containing protein, partial [Candidatus Binatia bacterium]|nr:topoisomerase C-terminal repeat-containing protein [Candidatus Binatia bacterium]